MFILSDNRQVDPIGYCGLEYAKDSDFVDIRYGLTPKMWGKGYAFQAALAMLTYGFTTLKLQKIYGASVPKNSSSISVLNKVRNEARCNFQCLRRHCNPIFNKQEQL